MISLRTSAAILTGALLLGGGASSAFAAPGDRPASVGRVYTVHTDAVGTCPSMDWHVVVGQGNTLSGLVASEDMKTVFRVAGTFTPGQGFHMDGKEIGGKRTGTVDGKVRDDGWLTATITSMGRSSACNGKTLFVKWMSPIDASGAGAEGSGG